MRQLIDRFLLNNAVHLICNWNIKFKILYVQHMECCIYFFLLTQVVPFDLMLL